MERTGDLEGGQLSSGDAEVQLAKLDLGTRLCSSVA